MGNILRLISTFGNSAWEFLFNNEDSNPFFSSDYPIAIEKSSDPRTMNKIFPLSPKMAIRIIPDTSLRSGNSDLSFSKFRYLRKSLKDTEASKINKMIVQCAEDLVFFSEKWDWTAEFIAKNRNFRIEPSTQKIPRANGYFNYSTQSIAEIVRD
ncbi:MAG: DUF4238 domain-containing protein [Proteobacteria bacterium]|nr:DUF4238 domain-containing protein [Pseudomonadota bacterium]